ncbi:hypothetical protein JHK87_042233 [Glycine soja]|nr:hypothetical protein JHK87_042233 [Glycine soja]
MPKIRSNISYFTFFSLLFPSFSSPPSLPIYCHGRRTQQIYRHTYQQITTTSPSLLTYLLAGARRRNASNLEYGERQ